MNIIKIHSDTFEKHMQRGNMEKKQPAYASIKSETKMSAAAAAASAGEHTGGCWNITQ